MPKPFLYHDDAALEQSLVGTLLAGLAEWRPDLRYPESHSDLQGMVRAVMRRFDVSQRPADRRLRLMCDGCRGGGRAAIGETAGCHDIRTCVACGGRGYTEDKS